MALTDLHVLNIVGNSPTCRKFQLTQPPPLSCMIPVPRLGASWHRQREGSYLGKSEFQNTGRGISAPTGFLTIIYHSYLDQNASRDKVGASARNHRGLFFFFLFSPAPVTGTERSPTLHYFLEYPQLTKLLIHFQIQSLSPYPPPFLIGLPPTHTK